MRAAGRDSGETLIEILLSITIMGIGVVAVMAALGTVATTSGVHRRQAVSADIVRDAAEAVQSAQYAECAASYAPTATPLPSASGLNVTATVVGVRAYPSPLPVTAGSPTPVPMATWLPQPSCAATGEIGAQRVAITVDSVDARVRRESVVIVKRQPCPSPPTAAVPAC